MNSEQFGAAVIALAEANRHRQTVVLEGTRCWQLPTVNSLCHELDCRWLTLQAPTPEGWISPQNARQLLGQEIGCAIIDLNDGVDADAIGVLAGAIRAGGLMLFLLADSMAVDNREQSLYLQRLSKFLNTSSDCIVLKESSPFPALAERPTGGSNGEGVDLSNPGIPATACQDRAVDTIMSVVSGQRKRPAVLVSDRGRGKSAALGIAAGQLLRAGNERILVTGSHRAGSEALFRHASAVSANSDSRLQWCEAESLVKTPQFCQLLIIDEAATLPLQLLEQLLGHYPRIAMATTVHGYEGSGRGFLLRFTHTLDRLTRGWRKVQLETPVRWAGGDPLEKTINRLLVLDAELPDVDPIAEAAGNIEGCIVEILERQKLVNDESLLREIFSLLVLSHYKTRPNDLQQLLDNPALHLLRLRLPNPDNPQTLGIALVVEEGRLTVDQARAIASGQSRPAGQMLPEILAINGVPEAATRAVLRVMRIVVHPSIRRQGLGSKLLSHLMSVRDDIDLFGTNFALSGSLIRFWRKNGYQLVHIGQQRTLQSGRHSGTFVVANSKLAKAVCDRARKSFWANFPTRLTTSLSDLEVTIIRAIIEDEIDVCSAPEDNLLEDITSVVNGVRDPRSVPAALATAAMHGIASHRIADSGLVIQRVLQYRPWVECDELGGEAGWRQGNRRLRIAFADYLDRLNARLDGDSVS